MVTFRNSGKVGSIAFRRLPSSKNRSPVQSETDSDGGTKFGDHHSPHQIFLNVETEKIGMKLEERANVIQGMKF